MTTERQSESNPDGWTVNRKMVFREMERLQEGQNELKDGLGALMEKLNKIEVSVEGLNVRTGIWGGLAGLIGGALAALTALALK